ncbi:MAG: exo-alpha-sialidase, partial [Armatimonadota bacterium]|nr:exo-alpha-sialidase [Armatimonadota bacterium]
PVLYVPCPGGHLKFHILWDEPSRLFWLVSSQATDSMTRPDRLPATRYNLPNNERHRLALHFSRNCIDWCFAGMVAVGKSPKEARNYASMVVDGDDLHILSRSGDARAKSAHDGNLITFHTVQRFRELVY